MIQDIAPLRLANEYRPELRPAAGDPVLYVRGQEVALRVPTGDACLGAQPGDGADAQDPAAGAPAPIELPRVGDAGVPAEGLTYLFGLGDQAWWLAPEQGTAEPPAPCAFVSNRTLRMEGRGPRATMFGIYTAVHLGAWYRANRYCGACATPLQHHDTLRALRCPSCGNLVFPRLNPAVIVCVCDPVRERIVLTRYARGRYAPIDALVAGFVEIGETIEDCVRREVREELGLQVKNIRYYKSQPWGVAGDILSGYWADVDGDPTLHMDATELGRAVWAGPDEIPGQPDDYSLTNEMMCLWRDEQLRTRERRAGRQR